MKKIILFSALLIMLFACENQGKKIAKENIEAKEIAETEKKVMIKGKVLSASDSMPISMAMIVVPGTNIGSMSDGTGAYMINIPETSKQLLFTANEYKSEKVKVSSGQAHNVYLKSKSD